MTNNAVILHIYFSDDYLPLLDAIKPIHEAYCDRWKYDFLALDLRTELADVNQETVPVLVANFIRNLLQTYEFVVKLDLDTLIWDTDIDLRKATDSIGVVRFSTNKPAATVNDFLKNNGAGKSHLNVGAVYIHRNAFTLDFVDEWCKLTSELHGWFAMQNAFNILAIKHNLPEIDIKWNYTRDRQGNCKHPVVIGYHSYKGVDDKLNALKADIGR